MTWIVGYSKAELKERVRVIRRSTPDCLEELYEMQNRICDLCEQPIQDICLAAIDHSFPVGYFATFCMPIELAISEYNHPRNLRAVHAICNSTKRDMSRDEWFALGFNNREVPRFMTGDELQKIRWQMATVGRIQGRKNVESGHIFRLGRMQGRKSVESGLLASFRTPEHQRKAARIAGQNNAKSGQIQALGRIQGRKNVESGFLASIGVQGGRVSGWKNVESGHLARISTKGGRIGGRIGGPIVNHNRWHVCRGITSPTCSLCRGLIIQGA